MALLRARDKVGLLSRSVGWKTAMQSRVVISSYTLGARTSTSSFVEFVLGKWLNWC